MQFKILFLLKLTWSEDVLLKRIPMIIVNKPKKIQFMPFGCAHTQYLFRIRVHVGVSHQTHFHSFSELVQYVIKENKILELFVQRIWTIQYIRNLLRASNKSFQINQIIPDVLVALLGFVQTSLPKPPNSNTQLPQNG